MAEFRVVIPARLHSTRLPDKPLADIAGLPMVVRVAQQAAKSGAAEVVVATDHARILQACAEHGVTAPLVAPFKPRDAMDHFELPSCCTSIPGSSPRRLRTARARSSARSTPSVSSMPSER